MKPIAYILLLSALLSGCDSCRPTNYAHVEYKDSGSGNFLLHSFTDSSVRLLNFKNDSIRVIPLHDIQKFILHGDVIDPQSPQGKARMEKSLEPNPDIWNDPIILR